MPVRFFSGSFGLSPMYSSSGCVHMLLLGRSPASTYWAPDPIGMFQMLSWVNGQVYLLRLVGNPLGVVGVLVGADVAVVVVAVGDGLADVVVYSTCSFGATDRAHYELVGTEGVLTLDNAYDYTGNMYMHVSGKHGEKNRTFEPRDQIAAEIEYFARCIREDIDPEPSGWEGLADVRILSAIQQSATFGRAVPVEPVLRPRRPDMRQEYDIEPHASPRFVGVHPPTK